MKTMLRPSIFILTASMAVLFIAITAEASHSWGGYHWARTSNTFGIKLGNNLTGTWGGYLTTASSDWSQSSVVDTAIVSGTAGRNCKAINGTVQVCNRTYGNNGWLGIAQIWISGSHITAGTVKMNDTYFNTASYNTPGWKQFVVCQEVGHAFGLDHQDENFNNTNLGTCMDYTNNPDRNDGAGNNIHPNTHDYDQLATLYAHLDSFATVSASDTKPGASGAAQSGNFDNASEWGRAIRTSSDGNPSLYVRDIGNGNKVITHVIWANQ